MAENTAGEQPDQGRGRPFPPGTSGNAAGRPTGARNRATLAAEALLEGQAEALTQRAIEVALEGDPRALKLCLERLAPVWRGRPVHFTLQPIKDAADVVATVGDVLAAVAAGELTPDEASTVASVLEVKRCSIEVVELEARLAALEQAAAERGR